MRGSAASRTGVAPGGALAGPWVSNPLWSAARAVPSLDLRFAENKSLTDAASGQSLVTFTRASSGTYVGSDGVLKTATTNEPRFDHSPTTGESLGLLVEEQRTNSIRNNTMVGAVAGTPGTAPTNWVFTTAAGITRELVGVGTENGISYIDYRFSGTATGSSDTQFDGGSVIAALSGQSWTSSAYVKLQAGSLANATITQIVAENSAAGGFLAASTQNITPTSSALGQQRASLSRTLNNASTAYVTTALRVTSAGAINITLRIGLPQLEQGAFATSVIPTTGTTATRSADVASITGTNFSSWYRQDEGTVFADATIANTGSNRFIVGASDATVNEEVALYWNTVFNSLVTDGAASQANSFGGTVTAGSRALHSFAYKANDFQGYGNAVALSADTSGTLPTADRLTIGSRVNSTFWTNGTIRRLTYWPARLANSTLQAITQ